MRTGASESQRLDFLDNARVICMMLVVPYHAAHLYESQKDWWVHSSDNSFLFDFIISLQKSFCMSAFFLVSGYFSALVIERKGLAPWVKSRIPRLAVPFIASFLTIQILQMIVIARHEGATSTLQFWGDYLRENDRINIFHLWFIPCLIILSSALALFVRFFGKNALIWNLTYRSSLICTLILALAVFLCGRIIPSFLPFRLSLAWQIFDFRDALYYVVPFFVGAKLFWDKPFFEGFLRLNRWTILGGFVTYLAVTATLHADHFTEKAIRDFALPLSAIFLSQVLIALCFRFLNTSNGVTRALSESSYTIYLFHHPVVFILGIEFLHIDANIFLEYLVVVAAAFAIPYAIHRYVIARFGLISFLFNGTTQPSRRRAVQTM